MPSTVRRQRDELLDAIENLLLQKRRQRDMEEASWTGSYPRKFPEWVRAWEKARIAVDSAKGET